MSQESDRARHDFISEAEELVATFGDGIDEIEQQGRRVKPAVINDVFRAVHSLKGLAGMLGFAPVAELAHRLEDLLDRLRLGKLQIDRPLIALLSDSAASVSRLIGWVSEGAAGSPPETSSLLQRIGSFTDGAVAQPAIDELAAMELDPQTRKSLTEYEEHRLRENIRLGRNIFSIVVRYEFAEFDTRLKALTAALNGIGEVLSTLPSADSSGNGIAFRLLFGSERRLDDVAAAAGRDADLRCLLNASAGEEGEESLSIRSLAPTIRVDVSKLDASMNVVGELFLTKARLEALVRTLRTNPDRSLAVAGERISRDLARKLDELQKSVIDLRLVPVAQLYARLSRIARTMARELERDFELITEGADTELDKMLVELASDPLMHIVRNAIDHGLEPAAERTAAGKNPKGRVTLRAYPRGSSVVIDVIDDGRGIDVDAIRALAISRGLITPGAEITRDEAHELLFAPGFSTSGAVSEYSGRGVGLDVVRSNIHALKGSIEVFSEIGRGATFRITLPITLAIINALIVRCGSAQYAIPLIAIDEIVRIDPAGVITVGGREAMLLREQTLPVIRLADAFGEVRPEGAARLYAVVARAGERQVAVIVDGVERQQEIVVKSVGDRVRRVPGIAGATDIGENEVVLVLDVVSLVEAFGGGLSGPRRVAAAED